MVKNKLKIILFSLFIFVGGVMWNKNSQICQWRFTFKTYETEKTDELQVWMETNEEVVCVWTRAKVHRAASCESLLPFVCCLVLWLQLFSYCQTLIVSFFYEKKPNNTHEVESDCWKSEIKQEICETGNSMRWNVLPPPEPRARLPAQSQFPGISHHHYEVDVSIDGRTHTSIIIQKFLLRHLRRVTAAWNSFSPVTTKTFSAVYIRAMCTFPGLLATDLDLFLSLNKCLLCLN